MAVRELAAHFLNKQRNGCDKFILKPVYEYLDSGMVRRLDFWNCGVMSLCDVFIEKCAHRAVYRTFQGISFHLVVLDQEQRSDIPTHVFVQVILKMVIIALLTIPFWSCAYAAFYCASNPQLMMSYTKS